jgi:hypothetical protein
VFSSVNAGTLPDSVPKLHLRIFSPIRLHITSALEQSSLNKRRIMSMKHRTLRLIIDIDNFCWNVWYTCWILPAVAPTWPFCDRLLCWETPRKFVFTPVQINLTMKAEIVFTQQCSFIWRNAETLYWRVFEIYTSLQNSSNEFSSTCVKNISQIGCLHRLFGSRLKQMWILV